MNATSQSVETDRRVLTYGFCFRLVDSLYDLGIKAVVISPGFRNSPLVLALHHSKKFELFTAIDERGGAFLALGIAKGSRSPVALLCTSGTAAANYLPAVLESSHSFVPLLVITADRPRELIGTGSNQCMNQVNLFGDFVRQFKDIDPPAGSTSLTWLADAVGTTTSPVPGPVHINLRFDEPFFPDSEIIKMVESTITRISEAPLVANSSRPSTGYSAERTTLFQELMAAKRPLVFLGAEEISEASLNALDLWAEKMRIPILAEMASGFPLQSRKSDFFWRADSLANSLAQTENFPDFILRIGCGVTGRGIGRLINQSDAKLFSIDYPTLQRNPELTEITTISWNLNKLYSFFRDNCEANCQQTNWMGILKDLHLKAEAQLENALGNERKFTEWHFYKTLEKNLSSSVNIFLGNSMPIRDFNAVFSPRANARAASNRGLSGIDGLIATSIGYASVHQSSTHSILGDLSFLHDMNSLSLLSSFSSPPPLTFWMINNGGGEIFRQVQTKSYEGNPEIFTTPKKFHLQKIAEAFSLPYFKVESNLDLERYLHSHSIVSSPHIVEVIVDQGASTAIRFKV